jgi:hypothetical protein
MLPLASQRGMAARKIGMASERPRRVCPTLLRIGGPALLLVVGCAGNLPRELGAGADAEVGEATSLQPPPTQLPGASACIDNVPGPRTLRRLAADELNATLRDLFRDPSVPVATFFNDPVVLGFKNNADALLAQDLAAQSLMDFAEQVATWADTHLAGVLPCATQDAACRDQFIRAFGLRAFREPLTDAQVGTYTTLFTAESSFAEGVHAVVQAMLQSPYFLYRRELGAPISGATNRYALGPFEIASELSYFLTGSMPDDALLAAATSGALGSPAEIDRQAARLLQDPRSQRAFLTFAAGWLGIDRVLTVIKDGAVYPLPDALRADMLTETSAVLLDALTRGGKLAELFTTRQTFLTDALAAHYGLPAPGSPTPRPVTLAPGQRDGGILAHGSVLTGFATSTSSSPVQRGKLVRTRLLCQNIPPPPPNVDTAPPVTSPTQTTRQHFEQHMSNPGCAGCHTLMDPLGFTFEGYDGTGRPRAQENGVPVDTRGAVYGIPGGAAPVPLAGLADLAAYVAGSQALRGCAVRYWTYFATGRPSWAQDACTYEAVASAAAPSDYVLRDLVLAVVRAPHFRERVQAP